jgi:hypothetical protein
MGHSEVRKHLLYHLEGLLDRLISMGCRDETRLEGGRCQINPARKHVVEEALEPVGFAIHDLLVGVHVRGVGKE